MRMVYSEALMDHFERPRQAGRLDDRARDVGTGRAGTPQTGGVLRLQVQVDDSGRVLDTRFQAYGPPALIASGSWLANAICGLDLRQAEAIPHRDIASALALPPERLHCALLAEDAMRAAITDYKEKQGVHA